LARSPSSFSLGDCEFEFETQAKYGHSYSYAAEAVTAVSSRIQEGANPKPLLHALLLACKLVELRDRCFGDSEYEWSLGGVTIAGTYIGPSHCFPAKGLDLEISVVEGAVVGTVHFDSVAEMLRSAGSVSVSYNDSGDDGGPWE
jgi:hypothetical protein